MAAGVLITGRARDCKGLPESRGCQNNLEYTVCMLQCRRAADAVDPGDVNGFPDRAPPFLPSSPVPRPPSGTLVSDRQARSHLPRSSLPGKVAVVSSLQGFSRRFRDACLTLAENTLVGCPPSSLLASPLRYPLELILAAVVIAAAAVVAVAAVLLAVGCSAPLGSLVLIRYHFPLDWGRNLQIEAASSPVRPSREPRFCHDSYQAVTTHTRLLGRLH